MEDAAAVAPDPNTRVVDGVKEFRISTTNGAACLLRALVNGTGWYAGDKEFARRKKLGRAIGKFTMPSGAEAVEAWDPLPYSFWLSDKLKQHARKCVQFFSSKGSIPSNIDDDSFDNLLIELGIELKDD